MPRRKSVSGVIDPISLIGVLFLIITLVVGTKVTNDRSMSLNISEKAADCFNECRQDSGRERCNERCGVNVNWKGEDKTVYEQPTASVEDPVAITTTNQTNDTSSCTPLCLANATPEECGCTTQPTVVQQQAVQTIVDKTTIPTNPFANITAGVSGGTIPKEEEPKYASRTDCLQNATPGSIEYFNCGQFMTQEENITNKITDLKDKVVYNITHQNEYAICEDRQLCNSLMTATDDLLINDKYIDYWQEQTTGKDGAKDVAKIEVALAAIYKGVAGTQGQSAIADKVLESVGLLDEANDYLDIALNQETVLDTADTVTFDKFTPYVSNYQRINEETYDPNRNDAVNYIDAYVTGGLDAETRKATVDLGKVITAELATAYALPAIAGSGSILTAAGTTFGQLGAITTSNQIVNASEECIRNGIKDEQCLRDSARAAFSLLTLGSSQVANTITSAAGYADEAVFLAKGANTIISGGNLVIDLGDTYDTCYGNNKSDFGCSMSYLALAGDLAGGYVDIKSNQFGFSVPKAPDLPKVIPDIIPINLPPLQLRPIDPENIKDIPLVLIEPITPVKITIKDPGKLSDSPKTIYDGDVNLDSLPPDGITAPRLPVNVDIKNIDDVPVIKSTTLSNQNELNLSYDQKGSSAQSVNYAKLETVDGDKPVIIFVLRDEYKSALPELVHNAQLLDNLGIGPKFYGIIEPSKGSGFVMDAVKGGFVEDVPKSWITDQTIEDLKIIDERFRTTDYYPSGDFQYLITPNGRAIVIDPGSIAKTDELLVASGGQTEFLYDIKSEINHITNPEEIQRITNQIKANLNDSTPKTTIVDQPTKPSLFGIEYNGFKNEAGEFTLWPLEKAKNISTDFENLNNNVVIINDIVGTPKYHPALISGEDKVLVDYIDQATTYVNKVTNIDPGETKVDAALDFVNSSFPLYNDLNVKTPESVSQIINDQIATYLENGIGGTNIGKFIEGGCAICKEQSVLLHIELADQGIQSSVVTGTIGLGGGHAFDIYENPLDNNNIWVADSVFNINLPLEQAKEIYGGFPYPLTEKQFVLPTSLEASYTSSNLLPTEYFYKPTKPSLFGIEYNGFKNEAGEFTLWPLEKITTPNPPIKLGEVFDPNIEIKNILNSPNRTEALADFKTKLAYQQKGVAKIQTELEKTILNNPAVTLDELTSQVNSLSKTYGLSNTQMGKLEDALTIYQERTTRISELLSDYPDKNDLFEAMFGKKPVGRIEISQGPISIHIKAYNAEDYDYLYNYNLTDPVILTNTNAANTNGGFFMRPSTLLPDTEGLIIVENNTNAKWYDKFFAPDVIDIHEDQHALNNLLQQADIYPAPLSGYSDSYYNLQKALELGDNQLINSSLQNHLDIIKTSVNYDVMDEMLAMLKDGTPNSTITKYITQPKNNGGIYDYYGWWKEDIGKIFNTEDLASNKSIQDIIDQNLGTDASKTVINNGLKAFDNLLSKGYTRDEALALLEKTALPNWPKVSERAPTSNFITRTTSYISGKIVTPTNLARFQTPSNYLFAGGIIYHVYSINKIINLLNNIGGENIGVIIKNW